MPANCPTKSALNRGRLMAPRARQEPVNGVLAASTTHFVMIAQGILYRGVDLSAVWPPFLALAVIGLTLFNIALVRFRRTIGTMA